VIDPIGEEFFNIPLESPEPSRAELRALDQQHHSFLLANQVQKLSRKQHPWKRAGIASVRSKHGKSCHL